MRIEKPKVRGNFDRLPTALGRVERTGTRDFERCA